MGNWKTVTLGEITSFMAKGIPPKYVEHESDDTIRVLNQKCNRNYRISYSESRLHNNAVKKAPAAKMLRPGDVLINSTGAGTAGRVAQIWEIPTATTIDGHMILLRPTDEIDPLYYGYAIKGNQALIESYAEGSTGQTEINKDRLKSETIISFPEDKEQQRSIARTLAALDEKVEENERINKNLEAQAMALINDYCASAIEKIALGKLMSFDNGYAFQSKTYLSSGKYRIITIKNVLDGKIDSQGAANINEIPTRMKSNCFLSKGDVLLSLTGNVGRVGIVYEDNLLLNQRVAKICPFNNALLPWLYYYFRLPSTKVSLETIAKGTAQQNLSPVETLKLQIPFEMASANNLSQVLLTMFNMEISNFIESQQLSKLRDVLLPKLMSGELDVSDIDL